MNEVIKVAGQKAFKNYFRTDISFMNNSGNMKRGFKRRMNLNTKITNSITFSYDMVTKAIMNTRIRITNL